VGVAVRVQPRERRPADQPRARGARVTGRHHPVRPPGAADPGRPRGAGRFVLAGRFRPRRGHGQAAQHGPGQRGVDTERAEGCGVEEEGMTPRWRARITAAAGAGAAVALALFGMVPILAEASNYVFISGLGSSWASVAIDQWAQDVRKNGIVVNYSPNGSAAGRSDY